MFFLQPLTRAVDLQTCAIDQNVDGLLLGDAIIVPLIRRARLACTTAQGRVIGNGEIQSNQLQHRGQEAFGLPFWRGMSEINHALAQHDASGWAVGQIGALCWNLIRGYSPATYQLAGYSLRKTHLQDALKRYRAVADQNPSAAYWTYRLLAENPQFRAHADEDETYLGLAARQGHLIAKKTVLLSKAKGRYGIAAMQSGIIGLIPLFFAMIRAVKARKKSTFT